MNSRSGLSLFELLVSIALLALIVSGLAGSMDMTMRVYERTKQMPPTTADAALRKRLRFWLNNATPPARLASFPVDFVGTETTLQFTTLNAKSFVPEAAALRITVQVNADTIDMTVAALADDGTKLLSIEEKLAQNITPSLSYYSKNSDSPGWKSAWNIEAILPDLVSITVPAHQQEIWADFVVGPALK